MDWYFSEDNAKVVQKPWGREVWLNYRKGEKVGDFFDKRYAFKSCT